MIIDFHNHFYPPAYLDALRSGDTAVTVTEDREGNPVLHYPGDYNVAVRAHRDLAYRRQTIEAAGVDLQVLSFTTPGVHVEEPERAIAFAGADHVMAGSDYPHQIGSLSLMLESLRGLPVSDADRSRMLGENARALLRR